MSNTRYTIFPGEGMEQDPLAQLALNLHWSWNHKTDEIWRRLDAELWELTHNPWIILQTVSQEALDEAHADPVFREILKEVTREREEPPRWFARTHAGAPLKTVAYFSMEYMLSEALPIYSGGLGNVAGDQLKAADDLGVPVVAIGLLYQQGYFRQAFDSNGAQLALFPFNDPSQLPIMPLRDAKGNWLRLAIALPGVSVWIRAWQAQVGKTRLYLLDSNDPANLPRYRSITGELYGGGPDLRILQEQVLGIGGACLLRALEIQPEVYHLNEGHAAFAALERAAGYMDGAGVSFAEALEVTRAGNIFTTHTPVEAGFDRFSADLMRRQFSRYAADRLRISLDQLLALGRKNPCDAGEPFNMAYLALRSCGAVNGVSRLHGEVSRALFAPLFPKWPIGEVPVHHVTNGVHVSTWDSAAADKFWTELCGPGYCRSGMSGTQAAFKSVADTALWRLRTEQRTSLVEDVRGRYARQIANQGGSPKQVSDAAKVLDPQALTLGFARRFATYKRPDLLLSDPDRLKRILLSPDRPVQLIVAGKAHPRDGAGQAIVQRWNRFIRDAQLESHVVFLSDYDMLITERMVGGVDVWVNTPRRPWEASGTSGMKVLVNGGLNLSELDGWWAEAYAPSLGWAIGDGREHGDDALWDAHEADQLYTLLETEIVPEFYARNGDGISWQWTARMKESMARLTPAFSAARTVREYAENYYIPAAGAYAARAASEGKLGRDLAAWKETLRQAWPQIHFGELRTQRSGDLWRFEARVHLGPLDPQSVRVELFAGAGGEECEFCERMKCDRQLEDGTYVYLADAPAERDALAYTPRIVPYHANAAVPLETNLILWQK